MGSQKTATRSKSHSNQFDSQGRVVDNPTNLYQDHGAFQEDHNQADQAAASAPHYPNTNQDLRGAEAIGASVH